MRSPRTASREQPLLVTTREGRCKSNKDPAEPKLNLKKNFFKYLLIVQLDSKSNDKIFVGDLQHKKWHFRSRHKKGQPQNWLRPQTWVAPTVSPSCNMMTWGCRWWAGQQAGVNTPVCHYAHLSATRSLLPHMSGLHKYITCLASGSLRYLYFYTVEHNRKETTVICVNTVSCHHWLNGYEFEQALGVGDGQGSLACIHGVAKSQPEQLNWLLHVEGWRMTF